MNDYSLHAPLDSDGLRREAARVGRRVVCMGDVGSTNDEAMAMAAREGMAAHGTVVFAERQSAGRGRQGRVWVSPRGAGINCSLLLMEASGAVSAAHVALAAGLAVCRAIEMAVSLRPRVRWPNDVFLNGRKVAGVLIECKRVGQGMTAVVVGIGINCLQQAGHFAEELRGRATSLAMEVDGEVSRREVAGRLLEGLEEWFGGVGLDRERLIAEWRGRNDDFGTRVTVAAEGRTFTGRILDVEPDAGLLFQTDEGVRMGFAAATASIVERHG